MPFKLSLKKSSHYNVLSKSVFVISVEMIDCVNVECTLTSESIGQECLHIACQRHGIAQPAFFGLQYVSRKRENNMCWIELDKPIKKQLDKYSKNLCVYMRVMYYVLSGVRLLSDETTRYHYFLQCKLDLIEGRILCTPQQAVELASYCMQAEFGNFDPERHTAHYLKDFQLFPKSFTDVNLLEQLTEAAIQQHSALQNLPQGTAEEYFICACQKLEGYGQELHTVRDKSGFDAIIGVSLTGVSVGYTGSKESRHFGWANIGNVINHKREFVIESSEGNEKAEFHFPDVETAKNAWKFCVLQHMFYKQHEMDLGKGDRGKNVEQHPVFQQSNVDDTLRQMESYEDVTSSSHQWDRPISTQSLNTRAQSTSCLDLNKQSDPDTLRSLLPSYRPAPDYETAMQHKYRNSSSALATSREALTRNARAAILYSSQPEIHQADAYASLLRYPDVIHNNLEAKVLSAQHGAISAQPQFTRSQQIIPSDAPGNAAMLHLYKPPPPYPSNRISSNSTPDLAGISHNPKILHPFVNNIVSGSSPDLVSSGNFYLKQYGGAGSALYQHQNAHPVHRSQSYLPQHHGTYENLASIFNNNNLLGRPSAVIVENPNITKHIKKVYDEHGNYIYCVPANMKQILQENSIPSNGFVVTRNQLAHDLNSSTEPIYENIPLPWQNANGGEMRARTQSIHSAPDVSHIQNQLQQLNMNQNQQQPSQQGSIEALYAKIDRSIKQSKHEMVHRNSVTENLNKSQQNLNNTVPNYTPDVTLQQQQHNFLNNNKTTLNISNSTSYADTSHTNSNDTTFNSTTTDGGSSASNTSSIKSKKRRWGILMGRSKSSDKVKSATLGREKEKKKDANNSNNKHRWSTGLPRFNPLPPSISKETMCQLLENKLADSQLFFEFNNIPKKKQGADFSTALLNENALFNRFKEVLPYEDNRLRLTPSRDNKYGYVNASHISATVGSKQRFYIAAQGPTLNTLQFFWQCVWEAEVYLIVKLTDSTEEIDYLPNEENRSINIGQDFQILWEFSQTTGHCMTSKVRLCHVASRRYRTIWHLHYTDWGEQGCPHNVAHFLGFLEEMQSVHQHSMGEIPPGHNKNPPILVHCTAGVGRTGLAILCDLLLYTVDHNQEVCIPRVVGLLRQQRAHMIQTIEQYRFVYSLLIHYLKQTRLI